MPEQPGQPKEGWPLPWIAASIAVFVIGYTFISLEYRKANRPYEPYHDLKERGQTHTLLEAGYQRISLPVDSAASQQEITAPVMAKAVPAGIPPYLAKLLFDQPRLPASYSDLKSASQVQGGMPYSIDFQSTAGPGLTAPRQAAAYVHGDTIVIVPECAAVEDDQSAAATPVRVTIPGGELKPGLYQVRLIGAQSSLEWALQVN